MHRRFELGAKGLARMQSRIGRRNPLFRDRDRQGSTARAQAGLRRRQREAGEEEELQCLAAPVFGGFGHTAAEPG